MIEKLKNWWISVMPSIGLAPVVEDMKTPCCDDWVQGLSMLDSIIITQFARTGIDLYKGKPFKYCPWCGEEVAT